MAVKISDLPIITTATDDDYLPMVDPSSGQTRRILKSDLLKELRSGADLDIGAVKANKADFSVADATARLALASPFEGLKCYQKDVDAEYIYDGSTWRRQAQWEELGRTTLAVAGDTISIASIAARKYLRIIIACKNSGNIASLIRFNNDSGTNYAYQSSYSGAAFGTTVSVSQFPIQPATVAEAYPFTSDVEVWNSSSEHKIIKTRNCDAYGVNATTSANFSETFGKWASTAQVTRVDCINGSSGDFAIGSEMVILGKD